MDIRVAKTKEIIKDNFIKLINEKSLQKITISEICQLSRCSRSTFYMHYLGKNDLLDEIINEYIKILKKYIYKRLRNPLDFQSILNEIQIKVFAPNHKILLAIINNKDSSIIFETILSDMLKEEFLEQPLFKTKSKLLSELYAHCVTFILIKEVTGNLDEEDISTLNNLQKIIFNRLA